MFSLSLPLSVSLSAVTYNGIVCYGVVLVRYGVDVRACVRARVRVCVCVTQLVKGVQNVYVKSAGRFPERWDANASSPFNHER